VSIRKLGIGGSVLVLWVALLAALAFSAAPALAAAPETPETGKANAVTTATTATLEDGVLNPHAALGELAEYEYRFRVSATECEGESSTAGMALGDLKEAVPPVDLTNLQPNVEYTFCLLERGFATQETSLASPPAHFTTKPAKPSIDAQSVSGTNSTSSTMEAQVNPNNQETSFSFEYSSKGTTGAGGKLEAPVTTVKGLAALTAGYGDQTATVPKLEGLTPGSNYYYRVVATNGAGIETGAVATFTTVPAPTTDAPNPLAATTATLQGHFTLTEPTTTQYSFTYAKGAVCTGENAVTTSGVEAGAGKGTEAKASAPVTELLPDTEYTACLTTSNQFGSQTGAPVHFTTLIRESATEVTATSAELHAEINPAGATTTYNFEYGPTTSYGSSTPEATLFGEDTNPHTGTAQIQGLTAATEYHYRVIATNTATHATTTGPDATFTTHNTGGEFKLPDNRAWEMVSPPNKHGARLEPQAKEGAVIQAAENGSALTYVAASNVTANPEGNLSFLKSQVLAAREPSGGWASRDIATPNEVAPIGFGNGFVEYFGFSPDLSSGVIDRVRLPTVNEVPLSPLASEATIYLREHLGTAGPGDYVPLVNDHNVAPGTHYGHTLEFLGASTNMQHIVLSAGQLTATGGSGLYEWTAGNLEYIGEAGPHKGYLGDSYQNVRGAVSEDGRHVFFQDNREGEAGHLYARLLPEEHTLQLDVVQGGTGSGDPGRLRFQYATRDGMKVYFTDDQRLTEHSTAEPNKPELYEYDFAKPEGHQLTDLTPNPGGTSTDVQGETEISENGEYVYFYANGTLDGAPEGACSGQSEHIHTCNLYLSRVTGGAVSTSLLATLSTDDGSDWGTGAQNQANMEMISSGASPDGRYFIFMSRRPLTGYDNRDVASGERDEEAFLYDALTNRLVCASCDPTGARPHGILDKPSSGQGEGLLVDRTGRWSTGSNHNGWVAGMLPGWTEWNSQRAMYRPRYIDNEGRLFFDSSDSLVPQDTNNTFDVYQYEQEGKGCSSSSGSGSVVYEPAGQTVVEGRTVEHGAGCVGLISSGESSEESAFLDAGAKGPGGQEGEDVFFLTAAQLSSRDVDNAQDVYDAHVCSSAAPCSSAAAASPACSNTDSCRAAPAPQPSLYGAPSSAMFAGAGNATSSAAPAPKKTTKKAVKCKRGYVKKKNKCVKDKKAKRAGHNRRSK
jgi:hypothetical protein